MWCSTNTKVAYGMLKRSGQRTNLRLLAYRPKGLDVHLFQVNSCDEKLSVHILLMAERYALDYR